MSYMQELATTRRREWWGWLGTAIWFFSTYQSYNETLFSDAYNMYMASYCVALGLPIIILGMVYSDNVVAISRIAKYTTPVAVVLTAVMSLFPEPLFALLFVVSAPLMAPITLRCCYGVIAEAKQDKKLLAFMSVITVSIFIHAFWLLIVRVAGFPQFVQFAFPALTCLAAYIITWREPPTKSPYCKNTISPPKHLVSAVIVFLLVCAFNLSSDILHKYFLDVGLAGNAPLYLAGVLLPAAGMTFYALLAEHNKEKVAVTIGLSSYLISLILALFINDTSFAWPLVIADGVGGTYADFFLISSSIIFFAKTEKPVLMASLGLGVSIFTSSFIWTVNSWVPKSFLDNPLSGGHVTVMAVLIVLILVAALFAFDRHREKMLADSLFAVLYSSDTSSALPKVESTGEAILESGFTQVEKEVAMLLMEGDTRRDISRRLHMTAAEVNDQLNTIKRKVCGKSESDPVIAAIVKKYDLTRRETDILRCLRRKMSNVDIAAELFISEETVKIHVRHLMKKLPVENRSEVGTWVEAIADKT
jgi:DNA-binding CsgD family transcriptional regulator